MPRNLLDELDADRIDMAFGIGTFAAGREHHKIRSLLNGNYLCMFNPALVGIQPPISLEDYVRLPHVLTSLRQGERGVVDDALEKIGMVRTIALTTPRFPGGALFGAWRARHYDDACGACTAVFNSAGSQP